MSYNKSGTFTYTPDIRAYIYTQKNGVIDVSQDIINFSMNRVISAVSSFSCSLANSKRKYNRVINTMDRIVVFLKRTSYVQSFTGYVTIAPIETFVPTPVSITAYCTLRNLQVTWWDDTLIEYQQLLLNYMDTVASSTNQTLNDGGVAQVIVNLLYKVAGWDPSRIHIAPIPKKFLDLAGSVSKNFDTYASTINQAAVDEAAAILGAQSIVSGENISVGKYTYGKSQTIKDTNAPDGGVGTYFTVSSAKALMTNSTGNGSQKYFPGKCNLNPVDMDRIVKDIYYCSVPFSYINSTDQKIVNNAKSWISYNNYAPSGQQHRGRLLILENTKSNRVVVLRATSVTQQIDSNGNLIMQGNQAVPDYGVPYVQCHPGVVAYLNGDVSDPSKWNSKIKTNGSTYINIAWADESQVSQPGPQHAIEQSIKTNIDSMLGISATNSSDAQVLTKAADQLVSILQSQYGAMYSQALQGSHYRETPNNPYTGQHGWFDCSGLVQWAYRQIGISVGGNTWQQWGNGNNTDSNTHGLFIDKWTRPQKGDILFWNVPSDGGKPPGHVSVLSQNFNNAGDGVMIQSSAPGQPVGPKDLNWNDIRGGGSPRWWKNNVFYMGARRPLTLHHGWGQTLQQNVSVPSTSSSTNYNDSSQTYIITDTQGWNTQWIQPNFNITASTIQGTPRAFTLDNPLMQDLTQVVKAGLRSYMSAPNGDFIAWFPDFYGVYGTDPAIEISDVEIMDFQIYHNDDELATHVAVIGDTTGIGQQVSAADTMTTQGIVSIQDASTMQLLFGKLVNNNKVDSTNAQIALNFLNKYGIRPLVQEQQVLHSHALEYLFALMVFMQQWAQQFTSTIQLTFMPELYPGMRVSINIDNESGGTDNYQFYCNQVIHQGDRTSGFTTQAQFTAPIKNGSIMHYGLDFVS